MTETQDEPQWYAVRCMFQLSADDGQYSYEERVTLWMAESSEAAITLAEAEAADYVVHIDATYIELAQSFHLFDPPGVGAEVFSLIRESELPPKEYLDAFFDTGREIQDHVRSDE